MFTETYTVPSDDPDMGYGFTSWDHFFVRHLKEDARPIHDLRDLPISVGVPRYIDSGLVIHHACESTVVRITENVRLHRFWLKAQPYSLHEMLNHDPLAEEFVDGTIVKAEVVEGIYYSALPDKGAPAGSNLKPGVPFGAYLRSQPWLTFVATPALIWIRAKDPRIGLLCFIGIGMVEVSTCDIKAAQDLVGKEVKTGQEIGMFHFGGSGHCLVFRSDKIEIPVENLPPTEPGQGLVQEREDEEPVEQYKYIYGWHVNVNSIIGWSKTGEQ
ncbi:hypothetical protein AAF712_012756 [Marasmius tenuissimus]|uniref:Phosphatidylserine decarboxylase n=1 Tax=Marasmius tenuissimus TaxID=585030 RepID=A0ABR2ZGK4_9AGAR